MVDIKLDSTQLECVKFTFEEPLLVVSGPGAGKTRVLCKRIQHMLDNGIRPGHILCITFTRKAALEMKTRLKQYLGHENKNLADQIHIGTIHSISLRVLRENKEQLNFNENFRVLTTNEQLDLVDHLCEVYQKQKQEQQKNQIIKYNKNNNQKQQQKECNKSYTKTSDTDIDSTLSSSSSSSSSSETETEIENNENNFASKKKKKAISDEVKRLNKWLQKQRALGENPQQYFDLERFLLENYDKELKEMNAVDFTSMITFATELLRSKHYIQMRYARLFRYILIDEFQDTSGAQFNFIQQLMGENRKITAVGDDYQSIYAFRGTKPKLFSEFKEQFVGTCVKILNINYRSSGNIVKGGSALIKQLKTPFEKKLESYNEDGENVHIVSCETEKSEANFVSEKISQMVNEGKYEYKDIAIVCRIRKKLSDFEQALEQRNIPFTTYGCKSIYERRELQDVLAHLKMVAYKKDPGWKNFHRSLFSSFSTKKKEIKQYLNEISKSSSLRNPVSVLKHVVEHNFPMTLEERRNHEQEKPKKTKQKKQSTLFQFCNTKSKKEPQEKSQPETTLLTLGQKRYLREFLERVNYLDNLIRKQERIDKIIHYIVEETSYREYFDQFKKSSKDIEKSQELIALQILTQDNSNCGYFDPIRKYNYLNYLIQDVDTFYANRKLDPNEETQSESYTNYIQQFLDVIAVNSQEEEPSSNKYEGGGSAKKSTEKRKALTAEALNRVVITTVHQSKGLEWPVVFLVRAVEGVMPVIKEGADREDELKIAFVGLTRAKDLAFVTHAKASSESNSSSKLSTFFNNGDLNGFVIKTEHDCLPKTDQKNLKRSNSLETKNSRKTIQDSNSTSKLQSDCKRKRLSSLSSISVESPPSEFQLNPNSLTNSFSINNNNNNNDNTDNNKNNLSNLIQKYKQHGRRRKFFVEQQNSSSPHIKSNDTSIPNKQEQYHQTSPDLNNTVSSSNDLSDSPSMKSLSITPLNHNETIKSENNENMSKKESNTMRNWIDKSTPKREKKNQNTKKHLSSIDRKNKSLPRGRREELERSKQRLAKHLTKGAKPKPDIKQEERKEEEENATNQNHQDRSTNQISSSSPSLKSKKNEPKKEKKTKKNNSNNTIETFFRPKSASSVKGDSVHLSSSQNSNISKTETTNKNTKKEQEAHDETNHNYNSPDLPCQNKSISQSENYSVKQENISSDDEESFTISQLLNSSQSSESSVPSPPSSPSQQLNVDSDSLKNNHLKNGNLSNKKIDFKIHNDFHSSTSKSISSFSSSSSSSSIAKSINPNLNSTRSSNNSSVLSLRKRNQDNIIQSDSELKTNKINQKEPPKKKRRTLSNTAKNSISGGKKSKTITTKQRKEYIRKHFSEAKGVSFMFSYKCIDCNAELPEETFMPNGDEEYLKCPECNYSGKAVFYAQYCIPDKNHINHKFEDDFKCMNQRSLKKIFQAYDKRKFTPKNLVQDLDLFWNVVYQYGGVGEARKILFPTQKERRKRKRNESNDQTKLNSKKKKKIM